MLIRAARRAASEARVNLSQVRRWFTDLSITAANVAWSSGVAPIDGLKGGATITPGQFLYQDSADLEYKLADCDADATSEVKGMALTNSYDGARLSIAPPGAYVNIGATTVAGTAYWLSGTAGGAAPQGDATPTSGDYRVLLFIGTGTAVVKLVLEKGATVIP